MDTLTTEQMRERQARYWDVLAEHEWQTNGQTLDLEGDDMKTYRIENAKSGTLLGYWDGETPDEAIAAMIEDAGGDGEPDEGWPEDYDTGIRAYEVHQTIQRRPIRTVFRYHTSGHRWAVQYGSEDHPIAALCLDGDGTDGTNARAVFAAEDAEAVDNWLQNLDDEDREWQLSDYLAFCADHPTGWL